MVNRISLPSLLLALAACAPELDDRTFLVDDPRILAIQSVPAEAPPGAEVSYSVLWADGSRDAVTPELDWGHCARRKPLAELAPVHPDCIMAKPGALEPLGQGASVAGTIPRQACRRFGPDTPEPVAGEPAGRPVDPDATGGFYQPVIVLPRDGGAAVGYTRISCGIAGATPQQLAELTRRYVRNENPNVDAIEMARGSGTEILSPDDPPAGANIVRAGETVTLRPSLPACDETPCAGAESYVFFEPQSRTIQPAEESIRIAWFADSGFFEADRTEGEDSNTWTAPEQPGVVRVWVVTRDERGGVGWKSYLLEVVAD